jgi:hypothetical protein
MRIIRPEDSGLSEDTASAYILLGQLPDGRICGIHRLMYHYTMHIAVSDGGYEDRYCLKTLVRAQAALLWWNGVGDPPLFHKYVGSLRGRRASFNRDVITGSRWPDNQKDPTDEATKARHHDAGIRRCLDFARQYETEPPPRCECGRFTGEADAA